MPLFEILWVVVTLLSFSSFSVLATVSEEGSPLARLEKLAHATSLPRSMLLLLLVIILTVILLLRSSFLVYPCEKEPSLGGGHNLSST